MNKNKILSKEIDNEKLKSVALYLLAFFIPLVLLIGIFIYLKVYPFGANIYLPIDAYGQYVAYLGYFKNLFYGDGSIFYSLSKSIGGEMYGLFAYYLLSPYNFITLLFEKSNMSLAFDIILILKMSTCSLTFVYYLNRRKKASFTNLIFGIMYAFSSYVVTYGFNIMWLDAVILLPIIIAGLDDLIDYKKMTLYSVTLSLCLITNYYTGFMVCVFAFIYFVYRTLTGNLKNKKELLKKIGIFIFSSISAALTAGVILIPVFIGLQNGRANFSFSGFNFNKNFELTNLVSKLFTNSFNLSELKNDSMPPLFCGVFANVLVILYFLNDKIKLREKILSFIVILIFIISFYVNGANLLWTMGNIPAWFKYRYAFCFAFFYIILAKKAFENREGIKIWSIILTVLIYQIIAILISRQNIELLDKSYIKLDILLAIIFTLLLVLSKVTLKEASKKIIKQIRKHYTKIILFIIFVLSTVNITYNTIYCIKIIREEGSKGSQSSYSFWTDMYNSVSDNLKQYDNSLYRMEKQDQITTNDPLILEYDGITYSASTYLKSVNELLERLGIRREEVHITYNSENTKASDMLLGIKYLIIPSNYEFLKNYDLEYEEEFYERIINIYKNPFYLKLGYAVNDEIFNTDMKTTDTFKLQNEILKNMTGINEDVYKEHTGQIRKTNEGVKEAGDVYEIIEDDAKITYEFEVESTDNVYIYILSITNNAGKVYINGEEAKAPHSFIGNEMINLGKREIGEKIKIDIVPKGDIVANAAYVYYENEEILKKHYDKLSEEQVDLEKIDNRRYKGKVNVKNNDQYVMLTIPYEEGWKITVDGEEIKPEKVLDSLIAIKLSSGEHEIFLEYTPSKIYVGIIASILGIILFSAYIFKSSNIVKE